MKLVHGASICGLALLGAGGLGCSASGSLSTSRGGSAKGQVYGVNADAPEARSGGTALDEIHIGSQACEGVDLAPVYEPLSVDDLRRFLEARKIPFEAVRARDDLHYVDLSRGGRVVRLRVATLGSQREAGRDLHEAMLEHGMGSWGVHRSNLAVLGPVSDVEDIVSFAVETQLACWGVLSIAGRDDNFVVAGGYSEL